MNTFDIILSNIDKKINEIRFNNKVSEKTQEPIKEIITIPSPQIETIKPETKEIQFKIVTKTINTRNIKAHNNYTILRLNGTGIIREAKISTKENFDLYLKSDNTELFNNHASFNELLEISHLSSNILSEEKNGIKTLIIKDINFNKLVNLSISFNGTIDILTLFCIYDIKIYK